MNSKQLIEKLQDIYSRIESDNYTKSNISYLIKEIRKEGLNIEPVHNNPVKRVNGFMLLQDKERGVYSE